MRYENAGEWGGFADWHIVLIGWVSAAALGLGIVSEVSMWGSRKRRKQQDDTAVESEHASAETEVARPAVSGLYVDIENLQGPDFAQRFLTGLAQNWPSDIPPLGIVRLYAMADRQVLWEMWSDSQFADVGVAVKGVQHFSKNASKNSADIALALDAVCDLMTGSVQHIVVVSDDSDFAALFGKVRELRLGNQADSAQTPFLWIMTSREHMRSKVVEAFSPNIYVRKMDVEIGEPPTADGGGDTQFNATELVQSMLRYSANGVPTSDEIAKAIIQDIDIGSFKSTDCQPIIGRRWPNHRLAKLDSARFGNQFMKDILPVLEKFGVKDPNSGKSPRQYEMTHNAKMRL